MGKQDYVVVEKKSTLWTAIKVILVLAVVCFVAYKIYQVVSKKRRAAQLEAEEASLLDFSDEELEVEEPVEAPADAELATAEDMQ